MMISTWSCFQMIDIIHHIKINKENKQRAWQINLIFNQQQQERYKKTKWWEKLTKLIIENKKKNKKILKNVYIDVFSSNHIKWQIRFFKFYTIWFLCSQTSTNHYYAISFSSKFFAFFKFFEMMIFLFLFLQSLSYSSLVFHHAWWSNIWLNF